MMRTYRALSVGVVLSVLSAAANALAQGLPAAPPAPYDEAAVASADAPESPEYKALIDEALNEYGLQHYEEARILFVRANVLSPNARALRGIGLAQYELRNYAECVVQLRAALSSQVKPLAGPMRTTTEDIVQRALRYLARVRVELSPAQATLRVDSTPVDLSGSNELLLRIGEHVLDARAEGFEPESRPFSVVGGELFTAAFALKPLAVPAPLAAPPPAPPSLPQVEAAAEPVALSLPPAAEPPTESRSPAWLRNPWVWGTAGVVVLGAAITAGVLASRDDPKPITVGGSTGVIVPGP
ncbi:MAG: hypothetical protein RL385_3899 [Pseudomonadota bacterium]|jgi:hypothetical protein